MIKIIHSVGDYRRYEFNDGLVVITNQQEASPTFVIANTCQDNDIEIYTYNTWTMFNRHRPEHASAIKGSQNG